VGKSGKTVEDRALQNDVGDVLQGIELLEKGEFLFVVTHRQS